MIKRRAYTGGFNKQTIYLQFDSNTNTGYYKQTIIPITSSTFSDYGHYVDISMTFDGRYLFAKDYAVRTIVLY